ncbi:hypothetical protein ACTWP5_07750 [Streptomyces sp. 4N509B]|uniref:hypothetical protein n=1 Tax=Streptomyces sp. 4N509B TaxID=3457413 RepID=UPI003FD007E6
MDFVTSALIASWVAICLLALVVSGLIRQVHQLSKGAVRPPRRVGIQPGAPAPGVAELVGDQRGAVLLFLSDGCRTCRDVLAAASDWASGRSFEGPVLLALYAGQVPEAAPGATLPAVGHRPDLFDSYDAIATPFVVAVGDGGLVLRSEPVGSRGELLELLDTLYRGQVRSAS